MICRLESETEENKIRVIGIALPCILWFLVDFESGAKRAGQSAAARHGAMRLKDGGENLRPYIQASK